jgi:HEAT repeat protein
MIRFVIQSLVLVGLIPIATSNLSAADPVIDSVMYRDPLLPVPKVVLKLPSRLPDLWLEALERPEVALKTQAAQAIARAHERGMGGMSVTVAPLRKQLEDPKLDATARLAIVRALIVLDAKGAAPDLARIVDADPDVRNLVDPALAKWNYTPIRKVWLERLETANGHRPTIAAIQGLATVREENAVTPLRKIVLDRRANSIVRVEAARALGMIRRSQSEPDAESLATKSATRSDRLMAALLLRFHSGDRAVKQLQTLGRDSEPTVAAVALARLIEIDSTLALPVLESALASPDANVRRHGVQILFLQPSEAHFRMLGDRLNDPHPDIRVQARKSMETLASKREWHDIVIQEGVRRLGGSDWRGLEQAAILLAQLQHKPASKRLIELLPHARGEVFVAAAWGLRQLAVPETLPAALSYFDAQYKQMLAKGPSGDRPPGLQDAVDQQLMLLGQFFGQGRHMPADASLQRLIPATGPNNPAGPEARAAAVWALGWLHEGKPVQALTSALVGRLNAIRPFDVEDHRVRQMCAIALGRMKAIDSIGMLREFYMAKEPSLDMVGNACGWAIEHITGEKVPPPGKIEIVQRNWFLVPTD